MNLSMQQIIDSFDRLPDSEKQKVAYAILRRSVHLEFPPLTDEDLIVAAEDLFLTLDARDSYGQQLSTSILLRPLSVMRK